MMALYVALTVFGVGVTIVDMFGLLGGHSQASSDGDSGDGDSGDGDSGDGGHSGAALIADVPGDDEGGVDDGSHADGPDASGSEASSDAPPSVANHGLAPYVGAEVTSSGTGGIVAADVERATRRAATFVSALRLGVYFSLGAGPTGLFALLTGNPLVSGALWAAAGGVFTAVVAKAVRSFARSELDSSVSERELVMAEAEILVSVKAGGMGKAVTRKFGVTRELFVRSAEPGVEFAVGDRVRLVGYNDECWYVCAWADEADAEK